MSASHPAAETALATLEDAVSRAARAIPPVWPLASSVAVNPFLGQTSESLAVAGARLARVAYRGTTWEALVQEEDASPAPGVTLYVISTHGNTLKV